VLALLISSFKDEASGSVFVVGFDLVGFEGAEVFGGVVGAVVVGGSEDVDELVEGSLSDHTKSVR
jgi:hypothetical protein